MHQEKYLAIKTFPPPAPPERGAGENFSGGEKMDSIMVLAIIGILIWLYFLITNELEFFELADLYERRKRFLHRQKMTPKQTRK